MKKSTLLPSFLLTLASVIFIYLSTYLGASYTVSPEQVVRPLLLLWLVLFLLVWPAYWLTRDWNWTGLLLIVIVLGLFSNTIFAYVYTITTLAILVLLWVAYRLLKSKLGFHHVFTILNSVSLVAIILSVVYIYDSLRTIPPSYYTNTRDAISEKRFVRLQVESEIKPDIYFILLDGYGRSDILQRLYGFDNSEFVGFLKRKGFVVLENSRANYPKTVLSVASTLNMDYVKTFAPQLENSALWWLMSPWIDHNRVRTSLEKIGYSSVAISTNWSITDNPTADYYFRSHPVILSDFERYFLGVTPSKMFQPLLEKFSSVGTFEVHRQSQLNNFDSLIEITALPGPKIIFAHIILPHPPFVFSSDGTPRDPRYSFNFGDASDYPGTPGQYRDQYVEQLRFLNSQLKPVVNSILDNSQTPPVIIFQADHGPGMLTDFASVTDTCLAERFSIFSAYYLPGVDPENIPDDITSVNLFRILFDEYFDAGLPLEENVQYYPRQERTVYDLEDVTSRMEDMEDCRLK